MTEKFKAEVGPYSSVVGAPIILRDANGAVIAQLKLVGLDPITSDPQVAKACYLDLCERIAAAINAGQPERQVKHLKRDQVYDVTAGAALFQVSYQVGPDKVRLIRDGDRVVTYRNPELGMTFVRFPDEFEDPTRFEKV